MSDTHGAILVVEDEPAIALGLEADLTVEGYEVDVAGDGLTALRRARETAFDLIVLDVMLPGKDGFEVCRELRRGGLRTPILMLTAKAQEAEKVMGLELGADDYVTKPFGTRELRARIKALLRRTADDQTGQPDTYRFGDVEVDFRRGELRHGGEPIDADAARIQTPRRVRQSSRARIEPGSADRRRVGARFCRLRPRCRQPHCQSAKEGRRGSRRPEVPEERARPGIPVRRLKASPYTNVTIVRPDLRIRLVC